MATKTPGATDLDLMFLLAQASHALQTEMTAKLAELGITPRDHCVLSKAINGDLTQSQLAELAALDKTTMVVTVDALEKAGLAERRPSSTDRRARIIAVTPAGKRLVREAQSIVTGIYGDVLGALPDAERKGFAGGLQRLVDGRLSTVVECDKPVRRRAPRAP